jgi:hypothetical protein
LKAVRFGCGFLFGVVFGGAAAVRTFYDSGYTVVAATILVSTVFGLLAIRYGDRYWLSLKKWIWFLG